MDSHRRRYSEGSSWLWLPILTFLVALGALIVAVVAVFLATGASNTGLHANFVTTAVNVTLAGVCDTFPIEVVIGKMGSQVSVAVPPFLCDGAANASDAIGGLRFTMPAGYDATIALTVGAGVLTAPHTSQYVMWCTGGPNATACDVVNNSLATIVGSVVSMGRSTTAVDAFLAPTTPYGPVEGFILKYFTANYSAALVTSDALAIGGGGGLPAHAMTMIAVGAALGLTLIS